MEDIYTAIACTLPASSDAGFSIRLLVVKDRFRGNGNLMCYDVEVLCCHFLWLVLRANAFFSNEKNLIILVLGLLSLGIFDQRTGRFRQVYKGRTCNCDSFLPILC